MNYQPRIRAGKLDRTVTIQRRSEVINENGSPVESWNTVATLRAELVSNGVQETVIANGSNQSIEVLRTFRTWFAHVTVADRLHYEGAAFDIIDVAEIPRRRGLEIKCRKRGL
jgi:SPP1 family predicted phage head-tail adaptor